MRQDIQFLRGWAVTIVVLQHAGIGPSAGYLGVDIFFVLSGYLITRIIQTQLGAGSFSFSAFYVRRAKRLLPAAFTTFVLTALAAPHFLSSVQLAEFRDQLFGALTFSANIILYGQSGYFDGEAELKPLLHIWSLAIEEQYYFVLPLLLFLTRRRYWIHITVATFFGSLGLCLYYLVNDPSFAFYALPTRAWELMVGSMIALSRWDIRAPSQIQWAFWPAFAAVLLIPFFSTGLPHPSVDSALVCLATAVIIICGRQFFGRIYPLRVTAWVGDVSYSLYLAHWPVIAFINNAYLSEVPLKARFFALGLSIALGLVLYYCVERPIHRSNVRFSLLKTITVTFIAGIAIYTVPQASVVDSADAIDFAHLRRPNYGLDKACDQGRGVFEPLDACQTNADKAPQVFLWGDSLAMHLAAGLVSNTTPPLIQATMSSCPPAFGYAQFNNALRYNLEWANRCVAFNRSVLRYLAATPSIDTVVIGSTFWAFTFNPPWQAVLYGKGDEFKIVPIEKNTSERVIIKTVQLLRKLGKRVVIFAPPPTGTVDYSECHERHTAGLITFGVDGCAIPQEEDVMRYGQVTDLLASVSQSADVSVIDPRNWLCNGTTCRTMEDNLPLYRDAIHLTVEGSSHLGTKYKWMEMVKTLSR